MRKRLRALGIVSCAMATAYACGSVKPTSLPDAPVIADAASIDTAAEHMLQFFVADATANDRLARFDDFTGAGWTTDGGPGSGTNQFGFLWHIFVDSAGKIYAADGNNNRVIRMDDFTGAGWVALGGPGSGSGVGQLANPICVFVDGAGKIYIADSGNNRLVQVSDMTGANWVSYGAAGSGSGQFSLPHTLRVDAQGKIYISDYSNNRLVRIDNMTGANWVALGTSGSGNLQMVQPRGIAMDPQHRIYVVDSGNNRIVRFDDMAGTNWAALGGPGSGANAGQFYQPRDVFVTQTQSQIFVADTFNARIVRIDDIAGTGWTTFGSNGAGSSQFTDPNSLFIVEKP